ncbi:MAG: hypothetical protein HYX65_00455 [Gemmatimonadetes bacterium]|nr:hypothetical protein [Gemmatimonadota bacterium]
MAFNARIGSYNEQGNLLGTVKLFNRTGLAIYDYYTFPNGFQSYWQIGPSGAFIELIGVFHAGSDPDAVMQTEDRAAVSLRVYTATGPDSATYSGSMPGAVDSVSYAIVVGPTSVPVGSLAQWAAAAALDTFSYSYQWRLDGQALAGATGATYNSSFSTPGSRTLSVINTRTDQTADTATLAILATYAASVVGPGTVHKPCTVTYEANVVGGVAPISYAWKLNGASLGLTTSSIQLLVNWTGAKSLSVSVVDHAGNSTSGALNVTGTTSGQCIE